MNVDFRPIPFVTTNKQHLRGCICWDRILITQANVEGLPDIILVSTIIVSEAIKGKIVI